MKHPLCRKLLSAQALWKMKRDRQGNIDEERTGRFSRTDSSIIDDRTLAKAILTYHRETKVATANGILRNQKTHELNRIRSCLNTVAELVERDEAYLPIFLRLEAEFHIAISRQKALDRAKSYRQTKP